MTEFLYHVMTENNNGEVVDFYYVAKEDVLQYTNEFMYLAEYIQCTNKIFKQIKKVCKFKDNDHFILYLLNSNPLDIEDYIDTFRHPEKFNKTSDMEYSKDIDLACKMVDKKIIKIDEWLIYKYNDKIKLYNILSHKCYNYL